MACSQSFDITNVLKMLCLAGHGPMWATSRNPWAVLRVNTGLSASHTAESCWSSASHTANDSYTCMSTSHTATYSCSSASHITTYSCQCHTQPAAAARVALSQLQLPGSYSANCSCGASSRRLRPEAGTAAPSTRPSTALHARTSRNTDTSHRRCRCTLR